MIVLTSTFSPAMLSNLDSVVRIKEISAVTAAGILKTNAFKSGIGHPATAKMLESILGLQLPTVDPQNRVAVKGDRATTFVVAQYIGPRLAEGQIMSDPDPSDFTFLLVTNTLTALANAAIAKAAYADGCEPAAAIDWIAAAGL